MLGALLKDFPPCNERKTANCRLIHNSIPHSHSPEPLRNSSPAWPNFRCTDSSTPLQKWTHVLKGLLKQRYCCFFWTSLSSSHEISSQLREASEQTSSTPQCLLNICVWKYKRCSNPLPTAWWIAELFLFILQEERDSTQWLSNLKAFRRDLAGMSLFNAVSPRTQPNFSSSFFGLTLNHFLSGLF